MAKTHGPGRSAGRGGCQSGAVTVRRSSHLAMKGGQTPASLSWSPSLVLSAATRSLSTAIHSCGSPKQSTAPSSYSPTTSASLTPCLFSMFFVSEAGASLSTFLSSFASTQTNSPLFSGPFQVSAPSLSISYSGSPSVS